MAIEVLQSSEKIKRQAEAVNKNLSKIKYRIAVLSGKGGVGKTTVSVNIACMLARQGAKVAVLDADIDCPNIGKILGVTEKFKLKDNKLIPVQKFGIKLASMDFFDKSEGAPTIWRGPLIHGSILQLLELADFGDVEYLIIDMPPGTSDAALTVMQSLPIDYMIIVTTPQELSLNDAAKSANMAKQFGKKTAIIENMSGEIFGTGGGEQLAKKLDVPFLGSIELSKYVRKACDEHMPIVLSNEKFKRNFEAIVERLRKEVLGK